MGSGSFDTGAYRRSAFYSASVSKSTTARQVFTSSRVDSRFDPKKIVLRESCISDEHPNPTPVILGLDCTGSMGFVAKELAGEGLPKLIEGLHGSSISSPHIMAQFIGDVKYDDAPLQATQFESDLRLTEQLSCLWLEGHGGGNSFESYNLPWYFAAYKTKTESFDKYGKKGYIFTVGDENVPEKLTTSDIMRVFTDNPQRDMTNEELLEAAGTRFNIFHITALEGNYARGHERQLRETWPALLGRRALFMANCKNFTDIILTAIRISEGEEREDVLNSYQDAGVRAALEKVFPAY